MMDPFSFAADWLQQHFLVPLLYSLGWMQWQDLAFGWALFAVYGFAQVLLTFTVCVPLERLCPVEHLADQRAVLTDVLYTMVSRVGIMPLVTFVAFYRVQVWFNGLLADAGWLPPTLETMVPGLAGHPLAAFLLYAVILDFADYWRHRLSHRFGWWYALHSVHHAQRQMTFWSDDRNHLFDDMISALWFGAIALMIGISPFQFPLLVLLLRFVESLSHANARLSFSRFGDRLLVSPRFHRAHHGVLAAGQRSCNYGSVLPWWDMLFGTADLGRDYARTGDPSGEEALATGSYYAQQRAGLRRFARMLCRQCRPRSLPHEAIAAPLPRSIATARTPATPTHGSCLADAADHPDADRAGRRLRHHQHTLRDDSPAGRRCVSVGRHWRGHGGAGASERCAPRGGTPRPRLRPPWQEAGEDQVTLAAASAVRAARARRP